MLPESQRWDFKSRDIAILKELAKNPQRSARELEDILRTEYDIDVSHVTISKAINLGGHEFTDQAFTAHADAESE